MILLTGVIYPLLITGIARLVFPFQAKGSLIERDGIITGSVLIGQKMDRTEYFQPRPSATDYHALPSGASNLALTSKKLREMVQSEKAEFLQRNRLPVYTLVPSEMVFASASGLDPHISPEAAKLQINRIAGVRGFTDIQVQKLADLVDQFTETPQFKLLGKPRVNVFILNSELDKLTVK